jgi:hypothetical protein
MEADDRNRSAPNNFDRPSPKCALRHFPPSEANDRIMMQRIACSINQINRVLSTARLPTIEIGSEPYPLLAAPSLPAPSLG